MTSSPYIVRTFGDPVLKARCTEIASIDVTTRKLAGDMITTMYASSGVGLAANQVGVQKRLFVYDEGTGDGPATVVNPVIEEREGGVTSDEGCLSVPGLHFPITRAERVVLLGLDLDGNELAIEAQGFLARIFQHEVDHLDGHLLLNRLDADERKRALAEIRNRDLKKA